MRRTINVFTSLIFLYSLVVCITCKQVSPNRVGTLQNSMTKSSVKDENGKALKDENPKKGKTLYSIN